MIAEMTPAAAVPNFGNKKSSSLPFHAPSKSQVQYEAVVCLDAPGCCGLGGYVYQILLISSATAMAPITHCKCIYLTKSAF